MIDEFKVGEYKIKLFGSRRSLKAYHGKIKNEVKDHVLHAYYNDAKKEICYALPSLNSTVILHEIIHVAIRHPSLGKTINAKNEEHFVHLIQDLFYEIGHALQQRGYKI